MAKRVNLSLRLLARKEIRSLSIHLVSLSLLSNSLSSLFGRLFSVSPFGVSVCVYVSFSVFLILSLFCRLLLFYSSHLHSSLLFSSLLYLAQRRAHLSEIDPELISLATEEGESAKQVGGSKQNPRILDPKFN